jgi:hypothetical protein
LTAVYAHPTLSLHFKKCIGGNASPSNQLNTIFLQISFYFEIRFRNKKQNLILSQNCINFVIDCSTTTTTRRGEVCGVQGSLAVLLPMCVDRPRETRAGVRVRTVRVLSSPPQFCSLVATTTCDTGVPARTVREPYLLLRDFKYDYISLYFSANTSRYYYFCPLLPANYAGLDYSIQLQNIINHYKINGFFPIRGLFHYMLRAYSRVQCDSWQLI